MLRRIQRPNLCSVGLSDQLVMSAIGAAWGGQDRNSTGGGDPLTLGLYAYLFSGVRGIVSSCCPSLSGVCFFFTLTNFSEIFRTFMWKCKESTKF